MTAPSDAPAGFKIPIRFIFMHVVLPMGLGGGIYILFRSGGLVMFRWGEQLQLMPGLDRLREHTLPMASSIPDFVLYSLPDGAWLYSYVAFFRAIWAGASQRWMQVWIGLGLLMSIGMELGQGLAGFKGTFDPVDLIVYVLATVLALRATLPADAPGSTATDLQAH